MLEKLKRSWQRFRSDPPGERFQERHHRHAEHKRWPMQSSLSMILGVLSILFGTLMLVTPGPGLLLIVLGASLVAEESLVAARWMDRMELAIRALLTRWRGRS